jgi:midasin (ATPase involved in ribosome maturation)
LRDIPGHPKELIIHKDFHLILTGNNPETTIGRKELPNEVSYFAEKIIYPETEKVEDIIVIVEKMIKRLTGQKNLKLAESLGNFHFEWSQEKIETED